MKLSNQSDYALRALIEISLLYKEKKLISAKEISQREGIPIKYLEQILLNLKLAGFIDSQQGIKGGYSLTRPPEDITLGEVIRSIEGTVSPLSSTEKLSNDNSSKSWHGRFQNVMFKLRDAISDVVDKTSLADICKVN
jgi:Rrf2 family protein